MKIGILTVDWLGRDSVAMAMRPSRVLASAAMMTLAAALFQVVISAVPGWSQNFGAPEQLLARPALLIAAGTAMAMALVLAAAYAASGAGYLRRLPHLQYVLLAIGTVFTLRGLVAVPLALAELGLTEGPEGAPPGGLVSSAFALLLGILYLAGTVPRWRDLLGGGAGSDARGRSPRASVF
jgi:hypothetical protein